MTKEITTFKVGDRLADTFNVASVDKLGRALTLNVIGPDGSNTPQIKPEAAETYSRSLTDFTIQYTRAASATCLLEFDANGKTTKVSIMLGYNDPVLTNE